MFAFFALLGPLCMAQPVVGSMRAKQHRRCGERSADEVFLRAPDGRQIQIRRTACRPARANRRARRTVRSRSSNVLGGFHRDRKSGPQDTVRVLKNEFSGPVVFKNGGPFSSYIRFEIFWEENVGAIVFRVGWR
jgi:hypothetical protein